MSVFQKIARKHFDREIHGDGQWLLASECSPALPVMLFGLESQRAATAELWASHGCSAETCRGAHVEKRIRPQPEYVWERD